MKVSDHQRKSMQRIADATKELTKLREQYPEAVMYAVKMRLPDTLYNRRPWPDQIPFENKLLAEIIVADNVREKEIQAEVNKK